MIFNSEQGEVLILEVRKHWFIAFLHTFSFFLASATPAILYIFLSYFDFPFKEIIKENEMIWNSGLFFYFIWIIFMWISYALKMTNFYLDVWYIGSRRILDIEQKMMFVRNEAVLEYEDIQDITVDTRGFFQAILGYGNICVQTAGKRREFIMKNATDAEIVRRTIVTQSDKIKKEGLAVRVVS